MALRVTALVILSLVFLFAHSLGAYAGEPSDQVRSSVDKVLDILKNKELNKPAKMEARRAAMRSAVGERFDFEEMSKRTLALHWQKRTPDEKKEFVSLFSNLLERSYSNKIETYTDEKILYGEETVDGEYGVVKTKIITGRNVEIPIDYKLFRKGPQWMVYDVVIEGVSLVNNYRNQFNKVIRTKSYEELVKRLRNKQEEVLFDEKRK